MDDDIDIYEDLPSFDAKESEKYKEEIKDLSEKCNDFQQENTELKFKVAELSDSNNSLSVNLSSLLKTARAEISRKDKMITELRQKLDNMMFRRTGYVKPKPQEFLKKPAENNTYNSSIRQEPFSDHPTQSTYQDNTYAPFIQQETFPVPPTQSIPYQDNKYAPFIQQEPFPVPQSQPAPHQEFEEEIEDPDQKYEPEKIATTVYGERLRKKILLEQEVERIQKEDAKRAMLENKSTTVKAEVEVIQKNENGINIIKNEVQEIPNKFVEASAVSIKSGSISNGSSLNSYEEDDRNLAERRELSNKLLGKRFNKDILFPQQKRRKIDDERYYSDDTRYYTGNVQPENRFNQDIDDNCRNLKNNGKNLSRRRGSDNRDDIEKDRRMPGEMSKSNHRSRSRSPDRRYVEKRADRHRTDKYRAYMDTYEKRRHNGLNRNNAYNNKYNTEVHDLREKIDYRTKSKIGGRNEYNNYKNNKFNEERMRGRCDSPPPVNSRSRSKGKIRENPVNKIGEGRSKSFNRLTNIWDEASERKNLKMRSNETKTNIDDRKKVVDEFKLEKSPRTSCEKEPTDKIIVSTALLPEVSEKEDTDKIKIYSAVFPDGFEKKDKDKIQISSVLSSDVSEKKPTDKQNISAAQFPDVLEKKGTDKQHIFTSVSIPKSDEVTEDIRKLRKSIKTDSKDLSIIATKEPKSQISSKANSEKEVTDKQIASSQLLPDVSEKEITNQTLTSTAQLSNVSSSNPNTCELFEESYKQPKIVGRRSNDSELTTPEQKNHDSTLKMEISSRKSFEKEVRYKLLVSLELLPDISKKIVTNQQVISTPPLSGNSASALESYKSSEISTKRKEARKKSKDPEPTIAEEKNCDSAPESSLKLKQSFEREIKNKQPDSTEQSLVVSASKSCEVPKEIKRERKSARRKSKDSEISIAEEKNRVSKTKSQPVSRRNSDKELINKQFASSVPLPDGFKNQVTNQQLANSTKLPDDLTSAEKSSEVPEEMKKQRKSSRTKSKDPAVNENKDRNSNPKSSARTSFEKEVTNKKLAMTRELPDVANIASGSRNVTEVVKKLQKYGRKKLQDPKPTVTTVKNCNLELKSQSPKKTNSDSAETSEQLVSNVPTVEDLISKLECDGVFDEQKALNYVNSKPFTSLDIVLNKIDNPSKLITSVLENDAEIPSIPLETSTDVGSRSFREEKIENIEKFIQNYQDDDNLCCQYPKRSTNDLDCENKSCDSTSSILDTLSMDIDVVAYCKPGHDVLDNSLISEQLLLESLSTPVKKNNSPLPPLPSLNTIKPPPLPPNSPPEEINQPPLPPNSPPEEPKQPPLPPDSPPDEMEMKSLPLLPSSDKNQQNPPPLPSPDEKNETLPPLLFRNDKNRNFLPSSSLEEKKRDLLPSSFPDEMKQNLLTSSSPEDKNQNLLASSSSEGKKQNLPPSPFPKEKNQNLQICPSPEEKKQNFPSLPFSGEKKQTLPSLLPLNESKQSSQSVLSPNKTQQHLLPSHETKNQVLPPLPSSDEEKRIIPPPIYSNDKKQQFSSPHPSPDHKKRRFLSSLLSSDKKKQQPLLPLTTPSAVLEDETKPGLLLVSASQKQTEQPLSLTSVDKTKPVLLAQLTPIDENDLPLAQKKGEEPERSVELNQNQKEDLLFSQVEIEKANSQLPSLPVLTQNDDLPLSLPPVRNEKENLQLSALPVPSKENDLPLLLLATPSDKKNETSSQSPSPADKILQPSTPVDKKSNDSAIVDKNPQPPVQINEKSQPPIPADKKTELSAPTDKKSQPPTPVDEKTEPQAPADKKLQPPAPADKKSQPPTPVDKKPQPPAPADKKQQPSVPADKKSQPSVSADEKSSLTVPSDKKSQLPVDKKSQLLTRSKKIDAPLAPTEKNLFVAAPSEKKNLSPAPIDKSNKISETNETSTKKPEPEKPRSEKVTLKAISRRHRISCVPIVSRYARKTRDLVLTDSVASLCLVKFDASSDNESIKNAKIKIKTSPCITKEAKIILKQIKTTEPEHISSEKSISNSISKIAKPETLSTDLNICSTENPRKIKSDIPNATSELQKTKKVDSVPEIIPPTLSSVEILNSEQLEHNSGACQSQLESKQETSPKPQNLESNSESENPICPKPTESRGTRLALKTIVTSGSGSESSTVIANRKKLLPKEKENQLKQVAKPCKIIIVARRRRQVNLEDSSTAITLVTSAQETNCDRPSRSNNMKNIPLNSEKPEFVQTVSDSGSKGRKRRSADK